MRFVISGQGIVGTFGVGADLFAKALERGTLVRDEHLLCSEVLKELPNCTEKTFEVRDFDANLYLGDKGHRTFDRLTKLMITAAKEALGESRVKADGEFIGKLGPADIGVCCATAYGSLDAITELNRVAELEDPRYINPQRFPNTVINSSAGYVSIWEDLRAPNTTIVDGNCGALDAFLSAETHLRRNRAKGFLVGGAEVITEPLYLALKRLGVLSTSTEPGLELGEGACFFYVESESDAQERNVPILALIEGFATAFEPPPSDGLLVHCSATVVAEAVSEALRDAKVNPADLDLVVTGISGVPFLDRAEREGLQGLIPTSVPRATPKALFGETFGASGAFGVATAIAAMRGKSIPVEGEIGIAPRRVLVVTVGFYGNASALILQAP